MTTTSEVGVTDSKMIIDEACRTAKAFIDRFYDKVDSKRPTLAKIYLDAATLSWNGNRIDGNWRTHFLSRSFMIHKSLSFF